MGIAFTDELFQAARPIWDAQLEHPFVKGIGDGSLDERLFKNWVLQDYRYLKEFARIFAWAAAKADRLALAKWLVQPNHPLTARVIVNRVWYWHFGNGIVPTPGNFGKMGIAPSHPELLDWLATEFIRQGWSMKQMHRLIMNSETYKLSSNFYHAVNAEKDPENKLYWRYPVRRLEGEIIRDIHRVSIPAGWKASAVEIYAAQPIQPNLYGGGSQGGLQILAPGETVSPDSPVWRAVSVLVPKDRAVGGKLSPSGRLEFQRESEHIAVESH